MRLTGKYSRGMRSLVVDMSKAHLCWLGAVDSCRRKAASRSSASLAWESGLSKDVQKGLQDGGVVKAETTRVHLKPRDMIATSARM